MDDPENGELFGMMMAAPAHTDGTFDAEEGMPVQDFAEPLTHGQMIDVLLGLGSVAVIQEREQRRVLEALCVAGEAVMDSAEDQAIDPGTEDGDATLQGLGKALDAARACLKVPDDWSTQDYANARDR